MPPPTLSSAASRATSAPGLTAQCHRHLHSCEWASAIHATRPAAAAHARVTIHASRRAISSKVLANTPSSSRRSGNLREAEYRGRQPARARVADVSARTGRVTERASHQLIRAVTRIASSRSLACAACGTSSVPKKLGLRGTNASRYTVPSPAMIKGSGWAGQVPRLRSGPWQKALPVAGCSCSSSVKTSRQKMRASVAREALRPFGPTTSRCSHPDHGARDP